MELSIFEWLFEPRFDYETQSALMVDLHETVITLIERIRQNTITRPDLLAVGIMTGATSLSLDGQDVFLLVEAVLEHEKWAPVHVRIFAGSQAMTPKIGTFWHQISTAVFL